MDDDDGVQTLLSMGFPKEASQRELKNHDGDVERAIESLLSPDGTSTSTNTTQPSSSYQFIHCDISQYNSDVGRSACTYIALTGALNLLKQVGTSSSSLEEVLTPTFIQNCITTGIDLYEKDNESSSSSVEHSSPEDVLKNNPAFSETLQLVGDNIRQGVLSNDTHDALNLTSILSQCHSDNANSQSWMAVVITKTPETVVVLVPPSYLMEYVLLDSHPRPQMGANGAYAVICHSLEELVTCVLKEIFPVTDLGPDVGDMVQMMYNSFDAYALHLKK